MLTKKQLAQYVCIVSAVFLISVGAAYWCGEYTARVPILMYHDLVEDGGSSSTISVAAFESHIKALSEAGYSAISFNELYDYAVNGVSLPERCVMITFDDGYMSVYESAFPILKKYDMKATAFVIGVYHGASVYKEKSYLPIDPRFGDDEASIMAQSGVFSIQSHSYDMHQFIPYETDSPRVGVLQKKNESRAEYIEAFNTDFSLSARQIENAVGERPFVYSYPFGRCTRLTEKLLKDLGVFVTVTISARINTVVKGSPGSLFRLGRLNVPGNTTPSELLAMIK